jgi:mRNA-degrading endonuclease YafQ of YafQ-DinJ toxin-antitoxin module
MYYIFYSKKFSKSLKRLVRARRIERGEIELVLENIASRKILDKKYKDHQLSGNM